MYHHVARLVARVWFGNTPSTKIASKMCGPVVRFRSALPCKSFGSPGLGLLGVFFVVVMCCKRLAQIQPQTTLAHKDHSDYFEGVGEDMLC